mmetsp:Transcript_16942/g.66082  ORF Transcript_16942/g.66082 Transcript_16942/m.66082 type:complete len:546 (+) Transcript_16942:189-1826(+)|eukprot:CAMPEP_0114620748 /NCGR_PEP_ID=MMETSP0168-20121206/8883_1 /TAXON_ID=95228 ORGANISM="Vannella sp., Strain DIVA3 517/6/12" /NCGR_SAMPLE_ID=MMETSP0168 /ASSEMBLY_ACC=CAM_ASM_000044 /LENGTH=545 /DNA_ID=CAMNT_0001831945 /DNA_START=186 /DNA_END=1823 /DNA_ORIENTATION=+
MHLNLRLACKPASEPKPYAFSEYGSFQEEDIRIGSKGLTVVEQGQGDVSYNGICLDDLEYSTETLGAGSSGVVKQALHVPTGTLMAVKVMSLNLEEGERRKALQELRTLHKCNHPNIVEFLGAFYGDGNISILLEFMDVGALDELLTTSPTMPEEVIGQLAAGLVSAMAYIHKELHIVHRDIKPSNVLVNSAGQVKLSDFGVSGKLANTIGQATTFAGTVTFMSPERIKGNAHSTTSDVWSLGVTLLQCAIGRFPYFDEGDEAGKGITFFDLLERIQNRPAPTPPANFSEEFRSFIAECLRKDPMKRPGAVQLLDHPFVVKHSAGTEALTGWIYDTMRKSGRSVPTSTPPHDAHSSPAKHHSCPERKLCSEMPQARIEIGRGKECGGEVAQCGVGRVEENGDIAAALREMGLEEQRRAKSEKEQRRAKSEQELHRRKLSDLDISRRRRSKSGGSSSTVKKKNSRREKRGKDREKDRQRERKKEKREKKASDDGAEERPARKGKEKRKSDEKEKEKRGSGEKKERDPEKEERKARKKKKKSDMRTL